MTRIAIMQPTYLPWIGYFGLMQSVDVFVLLDSVQFAKRSWQQRNQIKTPTGPLWLTIPVVNKGKRDQLINEVENDLLHQFQKKHKRSIEMNYCKSQYYNLYSNSLLSKYDEPESMLFSFTSRMLDAIRNELHISTPIVKASDLGIVGTKANLLASICSQLHATEYISPPGSRVYLQESDAFSKRAIQVKYFNYIHPMYKQLYGDFLPYMSTIDLLFNCGPGSSRLINEGCEVVS